MRDRLTRAQRESTRSAPSALDKIVSDHYRNTYPRPEDDPRYFEAWETVIDYLNGWQWPTWTDEQEAAIIAGFAEEGD